MIGIHNVEVEVGKDRTVLVRLIEPTEEKIGNAKRILGIWGFALRAAAPLEVQKAYVRTQQVPEEYRIWGNTRPMTGDHAAYGRFVILKESPIVTAEFVTGATAQKSDVSGDPGWIVAIQFDKTGARFLDAAAKKLFTLDPRGLMGVTFGRTLSSLSVVASEHFGGKLLMPASSTEEHARFVAAYLSSGYLPARLGGTVRGRFEDGVPESEVMTGPEPERPSVDFERSGNAIARKYASLSYAYDELGEFSENGVLKEGISAIEQAMEEYGRTREVDRTLLAKLRWLGTLFENPKLRLPLTSVDIACPDDRSALAVVSGKEVRVLTLASAKWTKGISITSAVRGMEFTAPDRLVVRTAAEKWGADPDGKAVEVRVSEQKGPVSVRVADCPEPGPVIGKSDNGRFIVYGRKLKSGNGILDLDAPPEGTHSVPLKRLTLDQRHPYAAQAYVSPDGGRVLFVTYDPADFEQPLFQLVDVQADTILATFRGAPDNGYGFSWSPDGRWIACHEVDRAIPDWDVPVGSTLQDYVRLYDGWTAEKKWSQKARDEGDFGWTDDGLVRCEGKIWDPRSGEAVKP